jgi:hypothetical protein
MKLFRFLSAGEGRAWKPVVWAALLAHVVVLGVYGFFFREHSRSTSPEMWAAFGDYMGGVLGPVLGLLTIVLLVQTLRQTDEALRQSREALEQSRAELQLTRDELKRGLEIQNKTEQALAQQIRTAQDRNDFDAAVTLFRYHDEQVPGLREEVKREKTNKLFFDSEGGGRSAQEKLAETARDRGQLLQILRGETERLITKYRNE